MKFEKNRIVILAPHPDDDWLGSGCRILYCYDKKIPLKIIMVTGRVKSRVKLCKQLAKKYNFELVLINEQEKQINVKKLKKVISEEIKDKDIVFIPTKDSHPDHRLINNVAKEILKNKEIYEVAVYNNASNIFIRLKNKFKSILTGKSYSSFAKGNYKTFSYKESVKIKIIKQLKEFPRSADVYRQIKSRNKKKLNIAFLTKDYHIGTVDAGFTSVIDLAKQLQKKGHFVTLISSKGDSSLYEPNANKDYEVFKEIHIHRPYGLKSSNNKKHITIISLINRFVMPILGLKYVQKKHNLKFDIIHGSSSAPYLILPSIISKIFAKKAKIFHTIRSETLYGLWGLKTSKLLNFSTKVFVPLNSLKNKLILDGCKKERLILSNSSIRINKFNKSTTSKEKLRNKFKIKKGEKVIVYYGKGGHFKGVDVLLKAINYIPKKEKVKFLLFHPVIWLPHIKKLAKEHKYKEKILLAVSKINVPDILNLADIAVFPFRSIKGTEGNPLCLLETMASKTPIITSDLADLKEIVLKDTDVLMAKPDNEISLAREIMRLIKDDNLRKKLSKNSFKKVQFFDIKKTAEKYLEQYNLAINN